MEPNPFRDVKETSCAGSAATKSRPSHKRTGSETLEKPARGRRWLAGLIVVVLVFLTGFLPMWLKAGRHVGELDRARREVKLLQLESFAAAAAVEARRGGYESARQAASQFFTALRAELDLGPQSSLSQAQQSALKPLLTHRDNLITLLARSQPASVEKLTEIYLYCRKSLRGR